METEKSQIHRVGWQAGDPGELMFQFKSKGRVLQSQEGPMMQMKSKGNLLKNFILVREASVFGNVRHRWR